MADVGGGVIISSQSGHRLPALSQEQNEALATTSVEELLELPFLKEIDDTLKACQYSKRCNVLRNIEKDNDNSSICRLYAFRRVSF